MKKLKDWIARTGTLNFILILVGLFFVWFNCQMLSIYKAQGSLPETYACAVVTSLLGECGICGWIRTAKERKQNQEEGNEQPQDKEREETDNE